MKVNRLIKIYLSMFIIFQLSLNIVILLNLKKEGSFSLIQVNEKSNLALAELSKNKLLSQVKVNNKEKSNSSNNSKANTKANLEASLFLERQKYEVDKLNALAETLF